MYKCGLVLYVTSVNLSNDPNVDFNKNDYNL